MSERVSLSSSSSTAAAATKMPTMRCPYAILTACSQSHPFDERRFSVPLTEEDALKIGRSIARFKPNNDNAIFDCKVLSRNHAILWYEEGAFLLKDTKSSNGTFVNNERLSKSAEESSPRQIYSGDILQFGVEIIESSNKVIHGCIIAMVRLFDSKGDEVCAPELNDSLLSAREMEQQNSLLLNIPLINSNQLFQLHQYIREAAHRESMLAQKLAALESILEQTEQATQSSWQALINEDRLLSRIEMLEGQLALYSKNVSSDKIKEEMQQLLADKNKFEIFAKDSLRRSLEEKNEALQRLADVERSLVNTEEESALVRKKMMDLEHELEIALSMNSALNEQVNALQRQIRSNEHQQQQQQQQLQQALSNTSSQENVSAVSNDRQSSTEQLAAAEISMKNGPSNSETTSNEVETLRTKLTNMADENATLRARLAQFEGSEHNMAAPSNSSNRNEEDKVISRETNTNNATQIVVPMEDDHTPILLLLVLPFFAFFYVCIRIGARIALLRPKSD